MNSPANGEGKDAAQADRLRADREATDWLIRLQEDPDVADLRAQFETWLTQADANARAWADTSRASRAIIAAGTGDAAAGAIVVSIDRARVQRTTRRALVQRVFAGGAAAAAACLAIFAGPEILTDLRADHVAPTGAVRTINLADGSVVKLAPGGALAVDFSGSQRRVSLLRGNAYFDVAHDASRPFQIAASGTTTTVLGTAFEVRRAEAGVAVAVRRGRVRVACDTGPAAEILAVGQSVDLACDGEDRRGSIVPSRIAAWVDGQLVVTDRPMREVVDALRPWYRGVILARGQGIDSRRVTGVYDLRHPQAALTALAAAHHARVREITPWVMVVTAD